MTSCPVGQEGHCFLVVCSSPWPRKEFDWNGDVTTRVDMRTTKVKFFKKYLSEGMSDPDMITGVITHGLPVLEGECFLTEGG